MAAWLERRLPAVREKTLGYRSIFIFPTVAGFCFLGLLAIILLAAINYQNNMLYAFVFLLGSVFATSILHCYRNLSGLRIAFKQAPDCYAGDLATFYYSLSQTQGNMTHSLTLQWPGKGPATFIPLVTQVPLEGRVHHATSRRGKLKPGRLLIQSAYPLGLIRAWSQLDLEASVIVYPKPVGAASYQSKTDEGEREVNSRQLVGVDDYQGLRTYQQGDSLRQIAWKQYAQTGDFYTKDFATPAGDSLWLDLRDYPGAPEEEKLSFLCARVLELSRAHSRFGLRLAGQEIGPDGGEAHRIECLRALGLYHGGLAGRSAGGRQ